MTSIVVSSSSSVGEWAWLRLHHRSASGITAAQPSKLAPCFYGPFQVLECIGAVAYRLQLPANARMHDVFHVALLKKFEGQAPASVPALPPLVHGRVLPTPEKVVRARHNRSVWELLVRWVGRAAADSTWESLEDFVNLYPDWQLEDTLFLGEEMLSTRLWVDSIGAVILNASIKVVSWKSGVCCRRVK